MSKMKLRVYMSKPCRDIVINTKNTQEWFYGVVSNGRCTKNSGVFDILYDDYCDELFFRLMKVLKIKVGIPFFSIFEVYDGRERPMFYPYEHKKPYIPTETCETLF